MGIETKRTREKAPNGETIRVEHPFPKPLSKLIDRWVEAMSTREGRERMPRVRKVRRR